MTRCGLGFLVLVLAIVSGRVVFPSRDRVRWISIVGRKTNQPVVAEDVLTATAELRARRVLVAQLARILSGPKTALGSDSDFNDSTGSVPLRRALTDRRTRFLRLLVSECDEINLPINT